MEVLNGESSNNGHVDCEKFVKSKIVKEYNNVISILNLAAITDGAQHVRFFRTQILRNRGNQPTAAPAKIHS